MKVTVLSNLVHLHSRFNTLSALCSANDRDAHASEPSSHALAGAEEDEHEHGFCLAVMTDDIVFVLHGRIVFKRRMGGHRFP